MTTRIITFEERVTEPRGVHALIVGPFGVGKTSLVRNSIRYQRCSLMSRTAVLRSMTFRSRIFRPKTWPDMRDLAVRIAGPNPSFGPNEAYSQEHFDRVGGYLPGIEKRPHRRVRLP